VFRYCLVCVVVVFTFVVWCWFECGRVAYYVLLILGWFVLVVVFVLALRFGCLVSGDCC